jgi:HAD superfamily hydrolase (TIGR01662 family)
VSGIWRLSDVGRPVASGTVIRAFDCGERGAMTGESRPDPPVRVVLFDMDDTLFDHTFALRQALAAVWRDDRGLGRRPLGRVVAEYERLLDDIHPEVLRGHTTHAEARKERFRRLFEWAGTPRPASELEATSARYRAVYQSARRPVEGAPALLRSLHRRATVGVVSNNHTAEQREKMAAIGIAPWVDFLVTSEDAEAEKPEPKIFQSALERANASAREAVMVGDNWATDVVGGRNAGIRTVWLNRHGWPRPEPVPDVLEVPSLRPIRPLRERLLVPWAGPNRERTRRDSGL